MTKVREGGREKGRGALGCFAIGLECKRGCHRVTQQLDFREATVGHCGPDSLNLG